MTTRVDTPENIIRYGVPGVQGVPGKAAQPGMSNVQIAGHSFLDDTGIGIEQKENTGRKIKEIFGVQEGGYNNIAVSGGAVGQSTGSSSYVTVLQNFVPNGAWPYYPNAGLAYIMWGTNDAIQGRTTAALRAYKEAMRTSIYRYMAAKVYQFDNVEDYGAITTTGDWDKVEFNASAQTSQGTNNQAPISGSGNGFWSTTTSGAYLEFDTPLDFDTGYIHIGFIGGKQGATADIYVDGVLTETVDTSGLGNLTTCLVGIAVRVAVPSGSHKIKVQCTGISATGMLRFNYWEIEANPIPPILVSSMTQSANPLLAWGDAQDPTLHDAINNELLQLVNEINETNVMYVNTDEKVNGFTFETGAGPTIATYTIAQWLANNYVIDNGEIGIAYDVGMVKIGDGVTGWNDLPVPSISEIAIAVTTTNKTSKTAAAWAADNTTILDTYEMGYESDTGIFKIGDGVNTYPNLSSTVTKALEVWTGLWDAGTTYSAGDVVFDNTTKVLYVCRTGHTNHAPPNKSYWTNLNYSKIAKFVTQQIAGVKNNWTSDAHFTADNTFAGVSNTSQYFQALTTAPTSGQVCLATDIETIKIGNGTDLYGKLPEINVLYAAYRLCDPGNITSDTAANWAADTTTILGVDEIGYETDTGLYKIGDGVNIYSDLPDPTRYTASKFISNLGIGLTCTMGVNWEYYHTDGLHPNPYGANVIAEAAYKKANDYISLGGDSRNFVFAWEEQEVPNLDPVNKVWVGQGTPFHKTDNFDAGVSTNGIGGSWEALSGLFGRTYDERAYLVSPHNGTATFEDEFIRDESATTLGSPWTAGAGTWGIKNNQAYLVTNAANATAYVDTTVTDHYAEAIVGSDIDDGWSLVCRYKNTSNMLRLRAAVSLGGWIVESYVAGIANTIGTLSLVTTAPGTVARLQVSGTNAYAFINGKSYGPYTIPNTGGPDGTGLTTYTNAGIFGNTNTTTDSRWDSFRSGATPSSNPSLLIFNRLAVIDEGWSDGYIGFTVGPEDNENYYGLAFRVQDKDNYYFFYSNTTFGTLVFGKMVAGVATNLDYILGAYEEDDFVVAHMNGNDFEFFVNGESVITYTDSTYPSNTKHGIVTSSHTFKDYWSGEVFIDGANDGDTYVNTTTGEIYAQMSNGQFGTASAIGYTSSGGVLILPTQTSNPTAPSTGYGKVFIKNVAGKEGLWLRSSTGSLKQVTGMPYDRTFWQTYPQNTTTMRNAGAGAGSAVTGTHSTPGISTDGWLGNVVSAGGAGVSANIIPAAGVGALYYRGASGDNYAGFFAHFRVMFPDASYNESGASTGSRINVGVWSATTVAATDRGTGAHGVGFQRNSVNAGTIDTNWQFVTSNNSGSSTVADTGIAFAVNKVYDVYIWCPAGSSTIYGRIEDVAAASVWEGSSTGTLPGTTTALFPIIDVRSINAVARNFRYSRMYIESDKG